MANSLSLLLLISLALVSGCGVSPLASRLSNPVLEDRVGLFDSGPIGIIATTADRRAITFRDLEQNEQANRGIAVEICAEPPPDIAANIASELSAHLAGSIGDANLTDLTASQKMSLVSQVLFSRSQGVQLYRDGIYSLCIASLNRYISSEFYMQHSREILNASKELSLKEIEMHDLVVKEIPSVGTSNTTNDRRR